MVNQQKGVQQETANSAVVVNDHMYRRPCLYHFVSCFYDLKNDIGTGIQRFAYKACMGPYSFLKHANS